MVMPVVNSRLSPVATMSTRLSFEVTAVTFSPWSRVSVVMESRSATPNAPCSALTSWLSSSMTLLTVFFVCFCVAPVTWTEKNVDG
jgi:hypothetical protein